MARTKAEKVKDAKPVRDAQATQAVILAAAEEELYGCQNGSDRSQDRCREVDDLLLLQG